MKIFSVYSGDTEKGNGISFSTSNLVTLSEKTGLGYENLKKVFTREKRRMYVYKDKLVIIKSETFFKGAVRNKSGNIKSKEEGGLVSWKS